MPHNKHTQLPDPCVTCSGRTCQGFQTHAWCWPSWARASAAQGSRPPRQDRAQATAWQQLGMLWGACLPEHCPQGPACPCARALLRCALYTACWEHVCREAVSLSSLRWAVHLASCGQLSAWQDSALVRRACSKLHICR